MRPKSEQEIWNENVANMQLKLAPKKDFERLLNESYDPIANAMRRHPQLTEEEAVAMAVEFGF
jgi:primosomal protein N''